MDLNIMIRNIILSDIANSLVMSSINTNSSSIEDRNKNIFTTSSYYLFSINKPAFSVELSNQINPLEFAPAKDSQPLTT